jgi:hypothetical protein
LQTNRCNGHGRCSVLSRRRYRCECNPDRHGRTCQYLNRCISNDQDQAQPGNAVCEAANAEGCRVLGNTFYCKCAPGHKWNPSISQCEPVPACLYSNCGLNEECVLNSESPDGYDCKCLSGYKWDEAQNHCVIDACDKACKKGQLCTVLPGEKTPFCFCRPGFKLAEGGSDGNGGPIGCLPIAEESPLVRQWNGCQQQYDSSGDCVCSKGYVRSATNPKECELEEYMKEGCHKCSKDQICSKESDGQFKCVCPKGLKGDNCDQDDYCDVESNAAQIQALCGVSDSECRLNDTNRFGCTTCNDQHELDPESGRCVFRQDMCQSLSCDATVEVCRLKYDDQNVLKASCQCALGHVRQGTDENAKCVPACSVTSCQKNDGECVFDPIINRARCTCRPGYGFESGKCVLSENAFHVRARLRLKLLPVQNEKHRQLTKLSRAQPDLDCSKAHDTRSCLAVARELSNSPIGTETPHTSTYLRLEFERTLEDVMHKLDDEWTVQSGQSIPRPKSQARILSLSPVDNGESKDTFDWNFGFTREYDADLALVVVGGELAERESQWRQTCVRKPIPDELLALESEADADTSTESQPNPEADRESIEDLSDDPEDEQADRHVGEHDRVRPEQAEASRRKRDLSELTKAKEEQQCVIMDRLSWSPRRTLVGWLDLCRLNLHNCLRYSSCQGRRGHYKCECESGFESVNQLVRAGFLQNFCLDVDECAESTHKCHKSTVCENTLGSYRCNCLENFRRKSAFECEGKS